MRTRFESLPEEKQARIREACIQEFVNHGYEQASTNRMTERAGISKGLLFHYFGSKGDLFLYLVDYVSGYFYDRFLAAPLETPGDIFDRITLWGLKKLQMFADNPLYYQFLMLAFLDRPKDLEGALAQRYQMLSERGYGLLLKDLDTSRFREDIDQAKAVEIILMTMDGLGKKYMELLRNVPDRGLSRMEEIRQEIEEYQRILKVGIYRP